MGCGASAKKEAQPLVASGRAEESARAEQALAWGDAKVEVVPSEPPPKKPKGKLGLSVLARASTSKAGLPPAGLDDDDDGGKVFREPKARRASLVLLDGDAEQLELTNLPGLGVRADLCNRFMGDEQTKKQAAQASVDRLVEARLKRGGKKKSVFRKLFRKESKQKKKDEDEEEPEVRLSYVEPAEPADAQGSDKPVPEAELAALEQEIEQDQETRAIEAKLLDAGVAVEAWGQGTRTVKDLVKEVADGTCTLDHKDGKLVRQIRAVTVVLFGADDQALVNTHQSLANGSILYRNTFASASLKKGEELEPCITRILSTKLGIEADCPRHDVQEAEELKPSPSYPGLNTLYYMTVVSAELPKGVTVGDGQMAFSTEVKEKPGVENFWTWLPVQTCIAMGLKVGAPGGQIQATVDSVISSWFARSAPTPRAEPRTTGLVLPQLMQQGQREGCVSIFDWDDTLFPTSWVDGKKNGLTSEDEYMLSEVATAACRVLEIAAAVGPVAIVTLAKRPWVEDTIAMYAPQFGPVLERLGVPVFYAREYRSLCPSASVPRKNMSWKPLMGWLTGVERMETFVLQKHRAMADALEQLGARDCAQLVVLGDGEFEMYAATNVWLSGLVAKAWLKTVKFYDEPELGVLGAQLQAVEEAYADFVANQTHCYLDFTFIGEEHKTLMDLLKKGQTAFPPHGGVESGGDSARLNFEALFARGCADRTVAKE